MKLHPLAALALTLACQKPAVGEEKGGERAVEVERAATVPVAAPGAVRVCPQSLGGLEKLHRVIARDCGVVEVTEDYYVDGGGSLTLEAGASLRFKEGTGLYIGAREGAQLIVEGTAQAPVVLTSAGDRTAGAWRGVALGVGASGSRLEQMVIEFAGGEAGALTVDATEVRIEGVKIRETKGAGLVIGESGRVASFTGNELRKIGGQVAIESAARAVAGLGAGNRFEAGARVEVRAGTIDGPARWQNIGAPLTMVGTVKIEGRPEGGAALELMPGLELRFAEAGALQVGGAGPGALTAKGTAQAPIVFTSAALREPGSWGGVEVAGQGEATLEHVALEFAGKDEERGALAVRGGQLSLRSAMFRGDRVGLTLDEAARVTALADNTFVATPVAVRLPAAQVAALGEGNAYDRESRIKVRGGAVRGEARWEAQGVALELEGEVTVDGGVLRMAAGLAVLAGPTARLTIGGSEAATLHIEGTAQSPVTIGPADAVRASWPGITLGAFARGNVLEHVVLRSVSAASAIEVAGGAEVDLRGVTCSMCSGAVVGWACGAKVRSSQVLAADGTPMVDRRPEGC